MESQVRLQSRLDSQAFCINPMGALGDQGSTGLKPTFYRRGCAGASRLSQTSKARKADSVPPASPTPSISHQLIYLCHIKQCTAFGINVSAVIPRFLSSPGRVLGRPLWGLCGALWFPPSRRLEQVPPAPPHQILSESCAIRVAKPRALSVLSRPTALSHPGPKHCHLTSRSKNLCSRTSAHS